VSHIFNLKSKYSLIIDIDKQLIFDGLDQRESISLTSIDIKIVDEENKEITLNKDEKDTIIAVISKIRSINGS
jgi:hypothetical protein